MGPSPDPFPTWHAQARQVAACHNQHDPTMASSGFILIADITGYTAYLRDSELEHAQAILADLLQLLVSHATPPLVVSRLEGDAVVAYAIDGGFLSGQTFVEQLEDSYVSFRRALQLMIVNTTCECRACANIATLDLKFFVHHGEFVLQKIGGHTELVGNEVNVIHRLVKNTVTSITGVRAYTLYTEAAAVVLGIDGAAAGWVHHHEEPADIGEMMVWVQDMVPAWERARDRETIEFTPDEIVIDLSTEVALPQAVVWDYIADPAFRAVLTTAERQEVTERVAGRVGEGSTFVCYHGSRVVPQLILEWHPFQRMVTKDRIPVPIGTAYVHSELLLEPTASGTRLNQIIARAVGPAPLRLLTRRVLRSQAKAFQRDLDAFARVIEADHAARAPLPT